MTRLYVSRNNQLALFPHAKPPAIDHADRGMALEKALKDIHEDYARLGMAQVDKFDAATKIVGDGKWARVVGRGKVDFIGLLDGGRFVAFDAKDCAERRIPLDRLESGQLEYLGMVQSLGGLAFILVRFEYQRAYRVPADIWAYAEMYHAFGTIHERVDGWKPTNKASLGERDMRSAWAVKGLDWLEGVMDVES